MTGAPFPRVVFQARRTYWEVAPGVFQATERADLKPAGEAGYVNLAALCRLKGDKPPTPREAGLAAQGYGVPWWNNPHLSGSMAAYEWDAGHTAGRLGVAS